VIRACCYRAPSIYPNASVRPVERAYLRANFALVTQLLLLRCMSPVMCRFSDVWDGEAVWALAWPASEKRQGTKSLGQRGCGYGDFAVRLGLRVRDCSGIDDRFALQYGVG
jgi:hypothetical protein